MFRILVTLVFCLTLVCNAAYATNIVIANNDSAGEGFNDATPAAPVGGNPGTTLGEQRLIVFEYAASIWESIIGSNVDIIVDAQFNPLSCTSTSAVLGSAGANTVIRDFTNAPVASTWYPVALANSLAGSDLSTSDDISATFNSDIDNNNSCLSNYNWYYGIDGNRPPNTIELLSVVMHEIGHGLGFQTFVNISTGGKLQNFDDTYMLNLEDHSTGSTWDQMNNAQRKNSAKDTGDLHWVGPNVTAMVGNYSGGTSGGHVEQYAPNPVEGGSSVSHFSNAVTPNELMEPFDTGAKQDPGLAIELMQDIGWQIFASFRPSLAPLGDLEVTTPVAQTTFVVRDADTALSSLAFSFSSTDTNVIDSSGLVVTGTGSTRTLVITPASNGSAVVTITVSDGVNFDSQQFQLTVNIPVTDTDGDGVLDDVDNCIADPNPDQLDFDGDSLGDVCDPDDDNDGLSDTDEVIYGSDPLNSDTDTDGFLDGEEVLAGYDPANVYSYPGVSDGDVSLDGIVDAADITIARKVLEGSITLSPEQFPHGDVAPLVGGVPDPDGSFELNDYLLIQRKAVGEIDY